MANLNGHTHAANFGRKVASCPGCASLSAGRPAKQGWQGSYYQGRALREQVAKMPHNCVERKCGPVCTFGDW